MIKKRLLLLGLCLFAWVCQAQDKPEHVILISIDGCKYDYVERFRPENLSKFIANGTAAKSLIGAFPTKTFPNHYAIATGMKPENNGLVDNRFYDPDKGEDYAVGNRSAVEDPSWYAGTPLWVLAEQQGMVAASYFFVGSETAIQGKYPSYFYAYDGNVPNLKRISQVFDWLLLPEESRPRLITMYFSDMDDVGHMYGPDNDAQLGKRMEKLDRELGALFEGLRSFDLNINVIIVSDHGMANVPKDNLINLDHLVEGIATRVSNNGALAHLYLDNPEQVGQVVQELEKWKDLPITIEKVSDRISYGNTDKFGKRMGDILIIPHLGYYLATSADMVRYQQRAARYQTQVFGEHGYHPSYQDMHGIFYANGPAIRQGLLINSFENVHVYPLICQILGLPIPADIDGSLEVLQAILK